MPFCFNKTSRFQNKGPLNTKLDYSRVPYKAFAPLSHLSRSPLHSDEHNTKFHHYTSLPAFVMPKYIYHSYAACKDPFTCRYPIHILEPISQERNTSEPDLEPETHSEPDLDHKEPRPESKQPTPPSSRESSTASTLAVKQNPP